MQNYLLDNDGTELREKDENDFVADFERANFQDGRQLVQNSSFEELQKASLNLEKRLHERIIKSTESKFEDSNNRMDMCQQQSTITTSLHNRLLFFIIAIVRPDTIKLCVEQYENI